MMQSAIRLGHPITFGALIVFSIIEMCMSAWLTAKYPANDPAFLNSTRLRFTLVLSVWTMILGTGFLAVFFVAPGSDFAGVMAHLIFLTVTWVLWMAAAGAITQSLAGGLKCHTPPTVVYCGQLDALEAFAWAIWVLLTLMLILALIRDTLSANRGNSGGLVD